MAIYHKGIDRLIKLNHRRFYENCETIYDFISSAQKAIKEDAAKIQILYATNDDPYGVAHYKGEIGEIFGEYLISVFAYHPSFQCTDFIPTSHPNSLIKDYGVDGYAKDIQGDYVAFQFKFTTNTGSFLNSDHHLGNFYAQASTSLGIPYISDQLKSRMVVVTTAQDIHPTYHKETFANAFRVLNHVTISKLVDGNTMFWNGFLDNLKISKT